MWKKSLPFSDIISFITWIDNHSWTRDSLSDTWVSMYNTSGLTGEELIEHWINDYK